MDEVAWIIVASFVMPLLISAGFTWFILQYQRKKNEYLLEKQRQQIKEKELLISYQQDLDNERNRIASEMHDDIGGGLTLIKHLGHLVRRKIKDGDPENLKLVEKIVSNSSILIRNMSEIIWAMNSENDSLQDLLEYLRKYGESYTTIFDLDLEVENYIDRKIECQVKSKTRRNIFLVVKESLHNTAKHAHATVVKLKFCLDKDDLIIRIEDNGDGFDENNAEKGNGLRNMKMRTEDIGGTFEIKNDVGTVIQISVPLSVNSNLSLVDMFH